MNIVKEFVQLVHEHEDYTHSPLDYLEDLRGRGHGEQESRVAIEDAVSRHLVSYDEKRRRVGRPEPDYVPETRRKPRNRK